MSLDPTAFQTPAPRLLIGPGERHVVYAALEWGRVEQRPEDADAHPTHELWSPKPGSQAKIIAEECGYTLEQLEDTHDLLEQIIDDPSYLENPTRECEGAMVVVEYAMERLGVHFTEVDPNPTAEADVLIPSRKDKKFVWGQCHCGSTVDLYEDGMLQCRDHEIGTRPTCLNKSTAQLPWRRRGDIEEGLEVSAEILEKFGLKPE